MTNGPFKKTVKTMLLKIPQSYLEALHTATTWALRERIGRQMHRESGGLVIAGQFRGMRVSASQVWSGSQDLVPYLTGTYEEHLMSEFRDADHTWDVFVDVGAASGYWAVGIALAGKAQRVLAYETSPKSREELEWTANENGVEIEIRGEFNYESAKALSQELTGRSSIVMVDIEGGEYELEGKNIAALLPNSVLIIELHSKEAGVNERLAREFSGTHNTKFLTRHLWSASEFDRLGSNLRHLPDSVRTVLLSEGRSSAPLWLVAIPKVERVTGIEPA